MADDDGSPERSLTVTDELVGDLARDVSALVLRTRRTAVVLSVVLGWLTVGLLLTVTGEIDPWVLVPSVVAAPFAAAAVVLGGRRSVRRMLAVSFPPRSTVTVRVTPDALHSSSPHGTSQITWSAYGALRVRGSAVVLRRRAASVYAVLPRALFTDDDLAAVRARIG